MAEQSIFTVAVHAGEQAAQIVPVAGPDAGRAYQPVVTPVHHSVAYTYADTADLDAVFAGASQNPVYARYGNPTVTAFETAVAVLEGGEAALAYSSGMAAIHGALLAAGCRAGSAVICAHDIYGATYALLRQLLATQGVSATFVDVADLPAVEAALQQARPAVLLVETMSNPLLKVADLAHLAGLAHGAGAALVVDNTFATPMLCRPLDFGADYVVHSATKYLGGHGDVLGGVVVVRDRAHRTALYEVNKLLGANLAPDEAWLAHRGLKTFPLRMARRRWPHGWPRTTGSPRSTIPACPLIRSMTSPASSSAAPCSAAWPASICAVVARGRSFVSWTGCAWSGRPPRWATCTHWPSIRPCRRTGRLSPRRAGGSASGTG